MIDLLSLKTIWIKKYLDKANLGKWKRFFNQEERDTLGVAEHRITAKNFDKYRNTAKKFGKYRNFIASLYSWRIR